MCNVVKFLIDVTVQFTSDTFTATEASGAMSVGVVLSGGVFDRDVTITVTTMEQTATGMS